MHVLYIQESKNLLIVFIHKKPDTLQKARQFPLSFHIKKLDTLRYVIFHEIFEVDIFIQNHDTFRYVIFLYTKSQTLRKKQDSLRYVFI